MKKLAIFLTVLGLMFARQAQAVCPVCTIAVGAGVGLSRWLGVDDVISGLWIGALTASMIWWTINWFNKKNIRFKGRKIITALGYYLLIVVPLFWGGIAGHPYNKFWGIDKLLLGIILGSVAFFTGANLYYYVKNKNNGRAHFPFEKIAMSVGPVVVLSFLFYFLTK